MTGMNDSVAAKKVSRLAVSANRRFLTDQDGIPFFYLADTAWTLFKRLDRDDVELYLANRAAKGFTVIQAYLLRGLEVTNVNGHVPLVDRDPTRLNPGFFENVDYIVNRANELGLVMSVVASMGEHVKAGGAGRFRARSEQVFDVDNAREFGNQIGRRYASNCVVWLLGGDHAPWSESVEIWDAMAEGLKAGSQGAHLISYHSSGGHSSSEYFHDRDWLDFNTVQSIHRSGDRNYLQIEADYRLKPVKPTLDMEARYEDIPDLNTADMSGGSDHQMARMNAFETREAGYKAVLAGACGHGYGHNDVWQLHDDRRVDSTLDYSFPNIPPRNHWRTSIDSPGAFGMGHMRRLMELRPWHAAEPDQSVVVQRYVLANRARDGSFILAYLPSGGAVVVDLGSMSGDRIRASWYDPRTGTFEEAGTHQKSGRQGFVAPTGGPGSDWVLVLDDVQADYPIR